jgi:DNA processing protein
VGPSVFDDAETFRIRGRWPAHRAVAIVGTRTPSVWGANLAAEVAGAAARAGWCVVSGLAPGIDAAAHYGALAAGGSTVAFVGTGLETLEDPELGTAIVAAGGGVVSVLRDDDPGDTATRAHRDRHQVLASRTVVVVEASQPCGTFATVAHAGALGRPVIVATPPPGPATATSAAGSRRMLCADGTRPPVIAGPDTADGDALWATVEAVLDRQPAPGSSSTSSPKK